MVTERTRFNLAGLIGVLGGLLIAWGKDQTELVWWKLGLVICVSIVLSLALDWLRPKQSYEPLIRLRGRDLDRLGENYNLQRFAYENDRRYRARLVYHIRWRP